MVHSQAWEDPDRNLVKSRREEEAVVRSHGGGIKHRGGDHHHQHNLRHHHHHHHHHHHKRDSEVHETTHEAAIATAKQLHKSADEGRLGETLIEVDDETGRDLQSLQMHLQPFAMSFEPASDKSQLKEEDDDDDGGDGLLSAGDAAQLPLGDSKSMGYEDDVSSKGEEEKPAREVEVALEEGSEEEAMETVGGEEEEGGMGDVPGSETGKDRTGSVQEEQGGYVEDDENGEEDLTFLNFLKEDASGGEKE